MTADDTDPWPVEPAEAPYNAPRKRMVMVEHDDDVWLPSGRYEWVMNPEVFDPKWEVYSRPATAAPHTKATWHPKADDVHIAAEVEAPPESLSWSYRQPELVDPAVLAAAAPAKDWASDVTVLTRSDVLKKLKAFNIGAAKLRQLENEGLLTPLPLNPGSKHKHYDVAKVLAFVATLPKPARRRPA